MQQRTKDRLGAAGSITRGVAQVALGVVTGTGHGLLGGLLKSQHLMQHAWRIGQAEMTGGFEHIEKGIKTWKRS